MKIREHLLTGVLVVTIGYSTWMTFSASRLRTELAGLKASYQQLEERHRRMKESYIQYITNPGTGEEAIRRIVAVFEADGEPHMIIPSGPATTRVNQPPGIQIK